MNKQATETSRRLASIPISKLVVQLKPGDILAASGQTVVSIFDSAECPRGKINVVVEKHGIQSRRVWNKMTKVVVT